MWVPKGEHLVDGLLPPRGTRRQETALPVMVPNSNENHPVLDTSSHVQIYLSCREERVEAQQLQTRVPIWSPAPAI